MTRLIANYLGIAGLCVGAAICHGQVTRNQVVHSIKTFDAVPVSTAKSVVPGSVFEAGVRFTNFSDLNRTPNGQSWYVVASTDFAASTAQDQGLLRGTGLGTAILAREGVTETAPGEFLNFSLVPAVRMNNAGQWAVAYRQNVTGSTSLNDRLVKFLDSTLQTVLAPGSAIPGGGGNTFNTSGGNTSNLSFNSVNVSAAGDLGFMAYQPGAATPNDTGFKDNGATIVADPTSGQFVPAGQLNAGSFAVTDIAPNTFQLNEAHTSYILQGTLNGAAAAIVDGLVRVQIGAPVPTVASGNVTNIDVVRMESSGDWFVVGRILSGATTLRFVTRNGAIIAESGQPIIPGSTELWGTAAFRDPSGDSAGNWIVNGSTTNASTLLNDVLVYNSAKVVARESDPLDLDGNGVYDDGLFLHTFRNRGVLASDDFFYWSTTLKATAAGTAGIGASPNNGALVRIRVCKVDFDNSGATTVGDIFAFLSAWFASDRRADFDLSGDRNVTDIFAYLTEWFAAASNGC